MAVLLLCARSTAQWPVSEPKIPGPRPQCLPASSADTPSQAEGRGALGVMRPAHSDTALSIPDPGCSPVSMVGGVQTRGASIVTA